MTDIWRDRNHDSRKFTWTGKNPYNNTYIRTRIVQFYLSSTRSTSVTKTDIIPFAFSDHDLISFTFDFNKQPRREGFWDYNNNLLDDDVFDTNMNNFWLDWLTKENDFSMPLHWWDAEKHRFKVLAIKHSSHLEKLERHERKQLENKIQNGQLKLIDGNNTISEKYMEAKTDLQRFYTLEAATCALKTKIQYAKEGENARMYERKPT